MCGLYRCPHFHYYLYHDNELISIIDLSKLLHSPSFYIFVQNYSDCSIRVYLLQVVNKGSGISKQQRND